MAQTQISDVIVPEIFTPYVQQLTEQKSRIIQSGAMTQDSSIVSLLAGGGLTFNLPSWRDLNNDEENISTDTTTTSTPNKTSAASEVGVRLSRNQSWSSMALTATLAGADPMQSIANRVSEYWTRRLQAAVISTVTGVFADNAAAPSGTEHTQNDLTRDISGTSFTAGTTDFSAEACIDALTTIGDSQDDLGIMMVHSIVYARMQKNNLIDFIPDARGEINIPTFLGREVVVDDSMPNVGGVYQTWFFGSGALRFGAGSPDVPTEVDRTPAAGTGGGQETLYNRVEWLIHPTGHKFAAASPANGGPSNAATTGNLANAASWERVYTERKQIKIARLVTREHAPA